MKNTKQWILELTESEIPPGVTRDDIELTHIGIVDAMRKVNGLNRTKKIKYKITNPKKKYAVQAGDDILKTYGYTEGDDESAIEAILSCIEFINQKVNK